MGADSVHDNDGISHEWGRRGTKLNYHHIVSKEPLKNRTPGGGERRGKEGRGGKTRRKLSVTQERF